MSTLTDAALLKYKPDPIISTNAILIIGASGSGKTSSAENLPPDDQTVVFNIENKPLPFRKHFKNVIEGLPQDHNIIFNMLVEFGKESAYKYLFIDSFNTYWEILYNHCRLVKKGYDIFNEFNIEIYRFLTIIKSFKNKFVILTARDEIMKIDQPDGSQATRIRAGIIGKDWEKRQVESQFTFVLFTDPRKNPASEGLIYEFITNGDGVRSAKTPAKYGFQFRRPNDIKSICDSIERVDNLK